MLEVLVGMVASGKSSYAKERAQEGWIVINDDSIVNAIHADQYTLYEEGLKPLYKSIENHIFCIARSMGRNVLVDRGLSLSLEARQRWLALGRSLDVPVVAVLFDVFEPEVHAQRRTGSDARGHDYDYWLRVAQRHHSVYVPPTIAEGFQEVRRRPWVDQPLPS